MSSILSRNTIGAIDDRITRHRFAASGRTSSLALALAAFATVSGCSSHGGDTYQDYVEGEFVNVGSGVAGRLERLSVERGQTLAANAPLFELEAKLETAAVMQADEALSAAEAQLADLSTGRRSAEVEVVRAQLAQAAAAEKQSGSQLARDTASLEAGGIAQMQLDASRAKHDVDVARVRELKGQLDVAELSARPAQIRAQTSQVAAARAAADQTRWRLDQTQVAAPQAGVVIDTLFRAGEWVPLGSPVVRMLPPGNVKVRFFVPQPSLSLLPIGKTVTIRCDGCAATVAATVSYIATEPEFTPPIIYSNENRAKLVFMIEARPAEQQGPNPALRPGQPVEVIVP
jgi:HlyD family secretion protein